MKPAISYVEPIFVVSSNIDAIGYNDLTLYIRFKSGGTYAYAETPRSVFDALRKAESAGQFFHRFIKGKYRYERLEHDPMSQPLIQLPKAA